MTSMKAPDYHNPKNIPESALKPGERFLFREEVGTEAIREKCYYWKPFRGDWCRYTAFGDDLNNTYKTTLPLPAEYLEPDYSDPEYRKGVEEARQRGARVQVDTSASPIFEHWVLIPNLVIDWVKSKFRIHPDDTIFMPENQKALHHEWVDDRFDREVWEPVTEEWRKVQDVDHWYVKLTYRPAQKPREKSQEELDEEAYRQTCTKDCDPLSVWKYACEYAREASRKGVA